MDEQCVWMNSAAQSTGAPRFLELVEPITHPASPLTRLDAEDALHRLGLALALGALEVAVDLRRNRKRRVTEAAAEPSDRAAVLDRDLCVRMAERVKGPLLAGRSDAENAGALHGPVELAKDRMRVEVAAHRLAGKDEAIVARAAALAPPAPEQVDDLGREEDVSRLAVLRRAESAVRVRAAHANNRLGHLDVAPRERREFAETHAGLERDLDEHPEDAGFRDPREPAPDSPALVYPNELGRPRAYLDRLRVHHVDLAKRFLAAADGALYPIDLFLVAATGRSYSLVDGLLDAFDRWNLIVGGPILRMQLDTLVRVSYVARTPNADSIVLHVIGGGQFRRFRDTEGKRLSDARLIEHARDSHPWVAAVYEATSGWVHFSPEHIRAAWEVGDEAAEGGVRTMTISGGFPIQQERIPLSLLEELLGAMTRATEELFGYLEAWESRKGLPLGQMRRIDEEQA
jgi:hypothetical protein